LEDGVFGEVSELVVNALSPVANLVVDNVNALESVTKLGEDFHHFSLFGLHGDDLLVSLSTLSGASTGGGGVSINLEFVQAGAQHIVILLQFVDVLVSLSDIGEQGSVVLFSL